MCGLAVASRGSPVESMCDCLSASISIVELDVVILVIGGTVYMDDSLILL